MPIHYSIDANRRLLTRADGVVTFHDINAHLDVERRNGDLHRPELIDARGATTDLTTEQVRHLVARSTEMLQTLDLGPTAIVTDNKAVYVMARLYAVLAERAGVVAEVFLDVDSATTWLGQFTAQGN